MPPQLFRHPGPQPHHQDLTNPRPAPEPSIAGARDRALLLVGFVGALHRNEFAALDLEHVADQANGLELALPQVKTNQHGARDELLVLPVTPNPTAARPPSCARGSWSPHRRGAAAAGGQQVGIGPRSTGSWPAP